MFLVAAACGGITTEATDSGTDAATDAIAKKDATVVVQDGGVQPACPATPPTSGASCAIEGLDCEYGTDARLSCNALASCRQGSWMVSPGADCVEFTDGGGGCPLDRSSIQPGNDCTIQGTVCSYGDAGICACGYNGPVAQLGWACDGPQTDPACPTPRPKLGTPCQSAAQIVCDYGTCSALGGNAQVCVDGTWRMGDVACPP